MPRNSDGTWNTKTGCPPYQFWTEQANRWRNSGTTHTGKRIIDGKIIKDKKQCNLHKNK